MFEALGFERRHEKDIDAFDTADIRMKVDDFDEAYQLLTDRGFRNLYGMQPLSTETSRSAMMVAPSGFTINLVHHIKKEV